MRIRSGEVDWPADRFDRLGHFKKRAIPAATRRAVALAAGGVPGKTVPAFCSHCGAPGGIYWPSNVRRKTPGAWVALIDLEFDHVVPEFRGGSNDPENIVLSCRPCNRRKGYR